MPLQWSSYLVAVCVIWWFSSGQEVLPKPLPGAGGSLNVPRVYYGGSTIQQTVFLRPQIAQLVQRTPPPNGGAQGAAR